MSTMIIEVYEAFKAANVPEEKAQAAAKALADYENRFNKVDSTLEKIEVEIGALKWMAGVTIAMNIAILGLIVNKLLT